MKTDPDEDFKEALRKGRHLFGDEFDAYLLTYLGYDELQNLLKDLETTRVAGIAPHLRVIK